MTNRLYSFLDDKRGSGQQLQLPKVEHVRSRIFTAGRRCGFGRSDAPLPRRPSRPPGPRPPAQPAGIRRWTCAVKSGHRRAPPDSAHPNRSALHSVCVGTLLFLTQTAATTRLSRTRSPDAPIPMRNLGWVPAEKGRDQADADPFTFRSGLAGSGALQIRSLPRTCAGRDCKAGDTLNGP